MKPPDFPSRRHPTHGIKYVAGQPTIIFDTLCVKDRAPILANDNFHQTFRAVASETTAWLIGRYVIMPDHIHLFAGEVDGSASYENWIKYLKSQLTKTLRGRNNSGRAKLPLSRAPGTRIAIDELIAENQINPEYQAPRQAADPDSELGGRGSCRAAEACTRLPAQQELRPPIDAAAQFRWLPNHWDTRIRNADVYEQKSQYVLSNPLRAGLVIRPEDWPYQGEIHELRW